MKEAWGKRSFRPENFAIRRDLSVKEAMPRKSDQEDPERHERIAKAIARAGLASRREAEAWIAAGRVAVNGKKIDSAALNVTPADRITVDGAPLPARERTRLFLYHKPRGLVTTNADPEGRPTIFDALPKHLPRLLTVGRLDMGTEGLLLLTNDGGLARVLELPETGWLRRYRVRALGRVTQEQLDELRAGITVDGIHYGPIDATLDRDQGSNVWLTFAIREGKNREVRNVLGHLGLQVNRLIRTSFGPFQLRDLAEGTVEEVRTRVLRDQLGERVIAEAKCDFAAPVIERAAADEVAEPRRDERRPRDGRERGGRDEPRREFKRGDRPRSGEERGRYSRHEERDDKPRDGRAPSARDEHRRDFKRGDHPRRDEDRGRHHRREQRDDDKPPGRPRRGHAWRQDDAPLRRHYLGKRDEQQQAPESSGPKRSGLLMDRKGRRVLVERFGEKKPQHAERKERRFGGPPRKGRPRRPDRARGPRPSRPKE
jgi:23S rRNA pseudouridine2605 synthase